MATKIAAQVVKESATLASKPTWGNAVPGPSIKEPAYSVKTTTPVVQTETQERDALAEKIYIELLINTKRSENMSGEQLAEYLAKSSFSLANIFYKYKRDNVND